MATHMKPEEKKDDSNAGQEGSVSQPTVLVFLNGSSGGKKGQVVRRKIEPLIPSSHLFDLDEVGKGLWKPEEKLAQFQHLDGVKVLICGGDGTMGWILSCIDRLSPLPEHPNFAVAMMPLGTGNDLARSYGWGPGFSYRMLKAKFLEKVKKASPVQLDRWLLCVMPYKPLGDEKKIHDTHMPPTFTVHTYSSNVGTTFGLPSDSEHGRTQSVLRMGRTFSTRMSSQAALTMHEDEVDRGSRRGSFNQAGSRRGSFNLTGSRHGQGGEWKDDEYANELAKNSASKVETAGMVRASSAPPAVRYGTGGNGSGSFPSGPGSKGGPGSTMGALPTVGETVAAYSGGPSRAEEAAMLAAAAVAEAVEAAVASASAASVSTEGEAVVESALASAEHEEARWAPAFKRSSSGDSLTMPTPADAPADAPVDAPAANAPAANAPAADKPPDVPTADATAANATASGATVTDAAAADPAAAADATTADATPAAGATAADAAAAADATTANATAAADATTADTPPDVPLAAQETRAPVARENVSGSGGGHAQVENGSDVAVTATAVAVAVGDGGGGGLGAAAAEGVAEPPPPPKSSPSPPKVTKGNGVAAGGVQLEAGVAAAAASAAASLAAATRLVGESAERREGVAPPERARRTGPMPRATPSISVTQRYDSWESYDAVFCNYFSFGVDAVAALAFHEHRNKNPHLFTSRCRNQLWYARKGFPAAGGIPCSKVKPPAAVRDYLELRVRRTREGEWETIALQDSLRGVVVLNLQSYGGGRNLWGKADGCAQMQYAQPAPDDKMLEIVGMSGILQLGCIMGCNDAGVRAHRLCQAAEVEIRVRSPTHMQIDGEPWLQAPAKICIKHYGQSTCLRGR